MKQADGIMTEEDFLRQDASSTPRTTLPILAGKRLLSLAPALVAVALHAFSFWLAGLGSLGSAFPDAIYTWPLTLPSLLFALGVVLLFCHRARAAELLGLFAFALAFIPFPMFFRELSLAYYVYVTSLLLLIAAAVVVQQ